MRLRLLTTAALLPALAGCNNTRTAERSATTELTPTHVAAMRDSVRAFLDAYAADMGDPPLGKNAQASLSRFYSRGIVMTTDLAPTDPVMVQTLDSLIPPTEVVTQPSWVRDTRFEWGTLVITPLAPGLASYSAKYVEYVTDSTGTESELRGTQQGVVRHEAEGWRLVSIGSSHPQATHRTQDSLFARMTRTK